MITSLLLELSGDLHRGAHKGAWLCNTETQAWREAQEEPLQSHHLILTAWPSTLGAPLLMYQSLLLPFTAAELSSQDHPGLHGVIISFSKISSWLQSSAGCCGTRGRSRWNTTYWWLMCIHSASAVHGTAAWQAQQRFTTHGLSGRWWRDIAPEGVLFRGRLFYYLNRRHGVLFLKLWITIQQWGVESM